MRGSARRFCVALAGGQLDTPAVEQVGGKACGLARCLRLGAPVPRSEVICSGALSALLNEACLRGQVEEYLRLAPLRSAEELEAEYDGLCRAMREAPLPEGLEVELSVLVAQMLEAPTYHVAEGLAVRSSAVCEDSERASFAGVFTSVLGVRALDDVVEALRTCWRALWAPRALRYAERMGIEPSADGMAVLLQPVVPALSAGVVYTAEPDTGNPWRFELHAAEGLAEDLMSGSGVGDVYTLEWDSGRVLGNQPRAGGVLSEAQAAAVAEMARGLDEGMGQRLDVEWVLAADGVWLVQARPMTALPSFFPEVPPAMADASWQKPLFVLPLRADRRTNQTTPFYADLSESELWYRYQPDDIVLTGVWREERDLFGHRFVKASPPVSFFDFFDDIAACEDWLRDNEPRYRQRWDQREVEFEEIASLGRAAIEEGSAVRLIAAALEVRDRLWDLNSFGWSGPQALGWMCEALIARTVRPFDRGFRVETILGGADSHTFELAHALQTLGRSIEDTDVRSALQQLPLDRVLPHLESASAGVGFRRSYETLCWRFGKVPPSWRHRPGFWSAGLEEVEIATMLAVRSALKGLSRDVAVQRREQLERRVDAERALLAKAAARSGEHRRARRAGARVDALLDPGAERPARRLRRRAVGARAAMASGNAPGGGERSEGRRGRSPVPP